MIPSRATPRPITGSVSPSQAHPQAQRCTRAPWQAGTQAKDTRGTDTLSGAFPRAVPTEPQPHVQATPTPMGDPEQLSRQPLRIRG